MRICRCAIPNRATLLLEGGENPPNKYAHCTLEPTKSTSVDFQRLAHTVHGQGEKWCVCQDTRLPPAGCVLVVTVGAEEVERVPEFRRLGRKVAAFRLCGGIIPQE
jgi:hypothetical protein